jgi:hypothetical protein
MKPLELFQPVFSRKPEPGHIKKSIDFKQFMELLRLEEDYFVGDQHNTKLMFTRLRKIFYDSWGWSTQVIRKAANIPGRYHTEMFPSENLSGNKKYRKYTHNEQNKIVLLTYKVSYSKYDRIYPERAGQTPEIYANDNQEIITPDGFYCDIGHIFSGIDAFNNFAPVSPLPGWLMFMHKLFPYVDSNMDFATWLGDIASTAGDFLLYQIQKKRISEDLEQEIIDKDAPGSDMIGNIDSYAIKELFNTCSENGLKVTEMLNAYFCNPEIVSNYQSKVISVFCTAVGLKNWDGQKFSNEKSWIKYYKSQLRNATAFYVYGEVGKIKGMWLAFKIWFRFYDKMLNLELLLRIFLDELKKQVINEKRKTK